ncbi:hypothetical protein I4U23_007330 [Adineta vaga]|nr:hypothetical protein I4U23_007330 [Adineta vaga]
MSDVDTSPIPNPSHPLSIKNSSRQLTDTLEKDSQVHDAFIQHLVVKQTHYQQRGAKRSNTNYTSSVGSIVDRTPSSLLELKQQRLLAAADRKKRIIARIVSIVGLLIILLCAAIVTLTLKMAPKIDELVRTKAGPHQLIHFVSRMTTPTVIASSSVPPSTTTITATTISTIRQDNHTINGSVIEKSLFQTRRKPFL